MLDFSREDRVCNSLKLLLDLLELLLLGSLHSLELGDGVVDGLLEGLLVGSVKLVAVLRDGVLQREGVRLLS